MNSNQQEVIIKVNIPVASERGHYDQLEHLEQHGHHEQHLESKTRPPQVRDLVVDQVIGQRRKSINDEMEALHGNVKFDKRSEVLKKDLKLEQHEQHRPMQHESGADASFADHREEEMEALANGQHVTAALESNAFRDHMEDHVAEKGSLGSRDSTAYINTSPLQHGQQHQAGNMQTGQQKHGKFQKDEHKPEKFQKNELHHDAHHPNEHGHRSGEMVHRPPSATSQTSKKSKEHVIQHPNQQQPIKPVSHQIAVHHEEVTTTSHAHQQHSESTAVEHKFYQAALHDSDPVKEAHRSKTHTAEPVKEPAHVRQTVVTPRTEAKQKQSKSCAIL